MGLATRNLDSCAEERLGGREGSSTWKTEVVGYRNARLARCLMCSPSIYKPGHREQANWSHYKAVRLSKLRDRRVTIFPLRAFVSVTISMLGNRIKEDVVIVLGR
jgi:hypothetical protein